MYVWMPSPDLRGSVSSQTSLICLRYLQLCVSIDKEKRRKIIRIQNGYGKEFKNNLFADLCASQGIEHEVFAPRHLNKLRLFNGKIVPYRKWHGLYDS